MVCEGLPPKPDTPTGSEDARGAPRQRMLKRGRIIVNALQSTFEVTVRDMSETGVKLRLQDNWAVPKVFELIIVNTDGSEQARRLCEKCWQQGIILGARFVNAVEPEHRGH
mgnify:CR=1 FL=1